MMNRAKRAENDKWQAASARKGYEAQSVMHGGLFLPLIWLLISVQHPGFLCCRRLGRVDDERTLAANAPG